MSEGPLAADDDVDPARFRAAREATARWSAGGDVHRAVAERLLSAGALPVLDMACGDGALAAHLPATGAWVGLDRSRTLLDVAPRPVTRADAAAVPFPAATFGAVVALWALYHLEEPRTALVEARRVLRPGGWFAASTTARDDSPELLEHFAPPPGTPFDAEEAVDVVGSVFDHVEAERWDAPLVRLPDRRALATYLQGRGVAAGTAEEVAADADVPFTVTKRGVLVWGRAPG